MTVTRSIIPAVCVVVKSLTLQEAVEILHRLCQDYLHQPLYVQNGRETTFFEIGDYTPNLVASLTSFQRFWMETGPPTRREWTESNLCQYVADSLLVEVGLQGEKTVSDIVADVIRKDAP